MNITLKQLRILLSVAETGSMSAAGRWHGMTQSGVSQAMTSLEHSLGHALLARSRDGVTATAFALEILHDAALAADAVSRIEHRASASDTRPANPLRVASVPSVAGRFVGGWTKRFHALYPETQLSLFEGHHIEIGDWVRLGVADVGLAAVVPADLTSDAIRREEMIVVAPLGHPILRKETASPVDVAREPLVTAGFGCNPILQQIFGRAAGTAGLELIQAQDIATALEMVRQRIGLSVLPETALPRPDMHSLRVRPLNPTTHRQLYLLRRPANVANEQVLRFRAIVQQDTDAIAR